MSGKNMVYQVTEYLKNKHHRKLLEEIKCISQTQSFVSKHNSLYGGHNEKEYSISNPILRKIVTKWVKENKGITLIDYVKLLNSIYGKSESSTEKYLGGYIIEHTPEIRNKLNPDLLDKWLENLTGWAQIDSLCQSKFNADDIWGNWKAWKKVIKDLNISSNIGKRRASLVLLTRPIRESKDERLIDLAFKNIEALKLEKDILITKAISWLLREMIKLHRDQVKDYLNRNRGSLPRIAFRETVNKLTTGKK